MRSHLLSAGALALAALLNSPNLATAASDLSGVWLDHKGRGAVEIKPCGERLCGYVVWVKDPSDMEGCGKQILGDVNQVGANVWDNGWIYSPERKKRYDVELKLLKDDQLRVKGYAGTKFFSKTMIWTKAPPNLTRCDVAKLEPGAKPQSAPTPNVEERSARVEEHSPGQAVKPEAETPPASSANPPQTARAPADDKAAKASAAETPVKPQENAVPGAAPAPQQEADNSTPDEETDFSDLPIDKYFKKTADGRCKLTLPWVKLDFACPSNE